MGFDNYESQFYPDLVGAGSGGDKALGDLTDVDTTDESKNDVLMFNGTEWVAVPAGTSFTFAIASFVSNASAGVQLIGVGQWKATGDLTFSASYTNGPATDGYVSHSGWSNLTLGGVGFIGPTVSVSSVDYPATPGSVSFTLHATDGVDPKTSSTGVSFYNNIFYGVSSVASGYTESDVEGLAGVVLSNSKGRTFTVTPGATEYIIYALPVRLGTVTFWVGGFEGGFMPPETVSVTNANGFTESYYVYRSTHTNLGTTTVQVI